MQPSFTTKAATALFLSLSLWMTSGIPGIAQTKPLLGPVEELSTIDDFTTDSKALWQISTGTNVRYKAESGCNVPGIANSLMQIELSRKDANDREGGHNWFAMKRTLPAGIISADATGIRLVMGSQPAAQWWINISLRVGNETYSHVVEPTYPNRTMIEHVIPFEEFTSGGKALSSYGSKDRRNGSGLRRCKRNAQHRPDHDISTTGV